MLTKPHWLLHLGGAAMLLCAIFLYRSSHFSWWLLALLFLATDFLMPGYVVNARWGAAFYHSVHT